jgi:hypothetical protein
MTEKLDEGRGRVDVEARGPLDVQLKSEVARAIRDLAEDSAEGRRRFTRQEVVHTLNERLEAAGWTEVKVRIASLMIMEIVEESGRKRKGRKVYVLTAKGRAEATTPSGRDYYAEAFNLILQQLETEGLISMPLLN